MMSFSNIYSGKRVLVTGNSGFKGSWLTVWLTHLGAEVHGLSNGVPTTPSMFDDLDLGSKIHHSDVDIRDGKAVRALMREVQPDFVFHLAAQPIVRKSYEDPSLTFETNALGTLHVLDSLRHLKHRCVGVFITSDKCYRNEEWTWGYRENDPLGGDDPYSASKAAAEVIINGYAKSFFGEPTGLVQVCSVRAGNVIGGGDWADNRIVPDAIRAWSKKKTLEIRSAKATRPWEHVLEPLSGYLHLGATMWRNSLLRGQAFNFGPSSEQNFTVEELLRAMSKHISFSDWRVVADGQYKEAGLLKLCCDKAFHLLAWKANLDFQETVGFVMEWYNAYLDGTNNLLALSLLQIQRFEEIAEARGRAWKVLTD